MALHALHSRMRRVLIRRVFGLHDVVTGLAAEGDGIHVFHRAVCELAGHYDVDDRCRADEIHELSQLRIARPASESLADTTRSGLPAGAASTFPKESGGALERRGRESSDTTESRYRDWWSLHVMLSVTKTAKTRWRWSPPLRRSG